LADQSKKRRILFLVAGDRHFVTRLPLARALIAEGHEVAVATIGVEHEAAIQKEGIRLIRMPAHRGFGRLRDVIDLYKRERPDLVHHVDTEQCLTGATAAMVAADAGWTPKRINMLTDPAEILAPEGWPAKLFLPLRVIWARRVLNRPDSRVVVQNTDDLEVLARSGLVARASVAVVPGAGLAVEKFEVLPEPTGPLTVAFHSRLLWSKGVGDLVEAMKRLRERNVTVRALLFGPASPDEEEGIAERQLSDWHDDGLIQWRGEADDPVEIWRQAHVAVLPSHREGLPRQMLEAAACGRPIVAAKAAGSNDVVVDGETGLLVPMKDPSALADALATLLASPERRVSMGQAGRKLVEERFRREAVLEGMLRLYRELLA
jgi:glycosyltransferase involved in cell wall biosynthesis